MSSVTVSLENLLVCFRRVSAVFAADRRRGPTVCVYILRVCVSSAAVLEANVVADLAGGAGAGLRQEEPAVGAHANLVDGLPGPGGRGAGGGLPLGQPHQADPASVQRDLQRKGEGEGQETGQEWSGKRHLQTANLTYRSVCLQFPTALHSVVAQLLELNLQTLLKFQA